VSASASTRQTSTWNRSRWPCGIAISSGPSSTRLIRARLCTDGGNRLNKPAPPLARGFPGLGARVRVPRDAGLGSSRAIFENAQPGSQRSAWAPAASPKRALGSGSASKFSYARGTGACGAMSCARPGGTKLVESLVSQDRVASPAGPRRRGSRTRRPGHAREAGGNRTSRCRPGVASTTGRQHEPGPHPRPSPPGTAAQPARRRRAPRTTSGSVVVQNGGSEARRKPPYRAVARRGSRIATTPLSLIVRSSRPAPWASSSAA
jgi:hypothetical protein